LEYSNNLALVTTLDV